MMNSVVEQPNSSTVAVQAKMKGPLGNSYVSPISEMVSALTPAVPVHV